jgi:hypothetical protein
MRRPVLYIVLSFLLLAMQREGLVHPFAHLGSPLARPDKTEWAPSQAGGACAECALLAAGSSAVLGDPPTAQYSAPIVGHARFAFLSRTTEAPSYYSSRAPPVLL